MGQLEDLRKDISDMDFEERLALIRKIRDERRAFQPSPAKVKKAAVAKTKNMDALADALRGMSPEELEALLGGDE